MRRPISVIVADDHPLVRKGVIAFLQGEKGIDIAGEAGDAATAAALCASEQPDVIVLDMVMPGGGPSCVRSIVQASPRTRVVVLTSAGDGGLALSAIQAGAQSYLLKDAAPETLAEAIRLAVEGQSVLSPRIGAAVAAALRPHGAPEEVLTPREREVLILVAEGLDNRAIAERLAIAEKTVKVHMSNLLAKLGVSDRTQAAVLAWKRGWVMRPSD
jgi:NarL family two-component system response regulator LiaR